MRIAFIGLGNMGAPMAANLAKAGRDVRAFDLTDAAMKRAEAGGCTLAPSASDAVNGADAVITMLPAGAHVRAVYARDVLPHARQGALLIDCSTIDIENARAAAADAKGAGLRAADAPVSGGVAGAAAGSLAFMVGCEEGDFAEIESVLAPLTRGIVRAGEAGAGQAAKICNNMLLGISMIGVCEAFALAEKLGLDSARFFEIAAKSSGQCWSLTSYAPWPGLVEAAPSNHGYEPGFSTAMMVKDLKLAQEAAAKAGAATPLGAQAQALYALFAGLGHEGKDFSAILALVRGRLNEL